MKILHVEGGRHLHGGAYQVLQIARGLVERGHQSLLACPRGSEVAAAVPADVELQALPMHGDADPLIALRLLRLLRRTRPDLIHLHSRIGADTWGGIAGRLAGIPVVHTRRVDNPEPRLVVAVKYRLHDRVIAISEAIARVLVSEGLEPAKLRVVRSAVDPERWSGPCRRTEIAGRLGVPADALWIGVIAQLIPRKGHQLLLEALPPLAAAYPRLRVLFFGRGGLAADLQRRINDTGLAGMVLLAGFRDDLPEILPCLDLLVHPATMEGLGVSLLQAASAGVPIIASNAGGIPEAIRDGENGLLVPPGDVTALREAVGALLADPVRRRALGQGGRRLMATEFSVQAMVEGNLCVYRELIAEAGTPSSRPRP